MACGDQQAHEVLPAHRDLQGQPVRRSDRGQQARRPSRATGCAQGSPGRDAVRVVTAPGGGFIASNPTWVNSPRTASASGRSLTRATEGASLVYRGADIQGMELRDIAELTYSAGFNGTSNDPPFLGVLLDNNGDGFTGGPDDHDVAFVPFSQPGGTADTAGRLIEYDVTEGGVRYDDDPGTSLSSLGRGSRRARHGQDRRVRRHRRLLAARHNRRVPEQPPLRGRRVAPVRGLIQQLATELESARD